MNESNQPRTVAWFQPTSGIAGDMALGALLDAGASIERVTEVLDGLAVDGWQLAAERVKRGSIAATHAVVTTTEQHHHRRWADIRDLLDASSLGDRVKARAHSVFAALAHAEAEVHGISRQEVHFHEVGALDAIVDVVGTAAALEDLGIDRVACGPVAVGTGTTTGSHGIVGNPPPAVVRLLAGFETVGVDTPIELTTPTGAAIVAALAKRSSPMPAMVVTACGFGAGTADPPHRPNVTSVVVGKPVGTHNDTREQDGDGAAINTTQNVTQLSTNVDDVTGEALAHTLAALIEAGALDAWVVPIVMKKGRPAHTLEVLCDPALAAQLTDQVMALTGTLGVRHTTTSRTVAPRTSITVQLKVDDASHSVRVKVGPHRAKAEFADVVAAASALNKPAATIAAEAEALALRAHGDNAS